MAWERWGACIGMVWLGWAILGCGTYRAGGVHEGNEADRQTACLDLRVTPHHDEVVDEAGLVGVDYRFGNPCRAATSVHLGGARVLVMDDDGNTTQLAAFDPRREIRPAQLDAGRQGRERIGYVLPPELRGRALDVCIELERVGAEPMHPVCFRWHGVIPGGRNLPSGNLWEVTK